ncbi:MAG: GNAT family N-acetyltransferase [Marinifilaceae bacterium]
MYRFRCLTLEELDKMEYQTFSPSSLSEWLVKWYSTFNQVKDNTMGFEKELFIVACYEHGELNSLLPLMRVKRRYGRFLSLFFLEFLGQQWSCIGTDLIAEQMPELDLLHSLRRWLRKNIHYHFLFLKYLPKESVFNGNYRFFKHGGSPLLDLKKYSDYEFFRKHRYSRNLKQNLRKALNKAKKNGIVVEETVEEINEQNLKEIKRISATKLLDGKSYLYGDKRKEEFYRFVYKNFQSNVVFVKFNGIPVSFRTNIFWGNKKHCIDAAYDRKYRNYNLGIWGVDVSIKDSFERGVKIHSMGPGYDSYKFKFADSVYHYFMFMDWRFRVKSVLLLPYFWILLKRKEKSVDSVLHHYGFET